MTRFSHAAQRERQDKYTPERIMQIARSVGHFAVSLRYRDEWLRRRCKKLRAEGLLVGGRRAEQGHHVFYAVKEPPK